MLHVGIVLILKDMKARKVVVQEFNNNMTGKEEPLLACYITIAVYSVGIRPSIISWLEQLEFLKFATTATKFCSYS